MTSKQRAFLKSKAHHLNATVQVGAASIHENMINSLNEAFNNRELLKVKVNRIDKSDRNEVKNVANQIQEASDIQVVAIIGTTIILYKEHKDPEQRMSLDK